MDINKTRRNVFAASVDDLLSFRFLQITNLNNLILFNGNVRLESGLASAIDDRAVFNYF